MPADEPHIRISTEDLGRGESKVFELPSGKRIKVTRLTAQQFKEQVHHVQPLGQMVCKHLGPHMPEEIFPPAEGLGDYVADGLKHIGITKARWSSLVSQFQGRRAAKEEDCSGCNWRQKALNWLGEQLGMPEGQGGELQALIDLDPVLMQEQYVSQCAIHGKCLPRFKASQEAAQIVRAAGFEPCQTCEQKEMALRSPEECKQLMPQTKDQP